MAHDGPVLGQNMKGGGASTPKAPPGSASDQLSWGHRFSIHRPVVSNVGLVFSEGRLNIESN